MAIAGRLRLEAQLVKSHANSWSNPMQTAGQVLCKQLVKSVQLPSLSRNSAVETFLANESVQVGVLERHADDLPSFNTIAELWGYESPNMARERAIREKDRQMVAELERRKRESYKVKIPGSQVCQDQGQVRYVGTVERVEGERVKVFVERAFLLNAPGLSPGGFRQEYYWVGVGDVFACS